MFHIVKCYLSDDTVIKINRKQNNILPNFSMIDYSFQSKIRPNNSISSDCSYIFVKKF